MLLLHHLKPEFIVSITNYPEIHTESPDQLFDFATEDILTRNFREQNNIAIELHLIFHSSNSILFKFTLKIA